MDTGVGVSGLSNGMGLLNLSAAVELSTWLAFFAACRSPNLCTRSAFTVGTLEITGFVYIIINFHYSIYPFPETSCI